jgi:3-deoxy-7-phosphoheptulonate synthase
MNYNKKTEGNIMIIVMKAKTPREDIDKLIKNLEIKGMEVHETIGFNYSILGLIGDTTKLNKEQIESYDNVEKVMRVQHPFKLASRYFIQKIPLLILMEQKLVEII